MLVLQKEDVPLVVLANYNWEVERGGYRKTLGQYVQEVYDVYVRCCATFSVVPLPLKQWLATCEGKRGIF